MSRKWRSFYFTEWEKTRGGVRSFWGT